LWQQGRLEIKKKPGLKKSRSNSLAHLIGQELIHSSTLNHFIERNQERFSAIDFSFIKFAQSVFHPSFN
jgi:hypothetical protein